MLIWRKIKTPYLKYSFLFLSTYLFCECVYVHMCVITGQLVEVGSLYLPWRLWGGTQVVRLSSKCLYLPRHLAGPEIQLLLSIYCLVCQLLLLRPLSVGGLERFPCLWKKRVWGIRDSGMILDKLEQAFTSDGSWYAAKGICVLSTFMVLTSYAPFLMS